MAMRWSVWLFLFFAAGCALGLGYYYYATPKYVSTAQLLLIRKDANLPNRGVDASSEMGKNAQSEQELLATHIQILQSRRIVGEALQLHGYDRLPSILGGLKKDQTPAEFVIERMTVTHGGLGQAKSGHALNVEFRHTSPEETQQILKAVIESFRKYLDEHFRDVGSEVVSLILKTRDELAQDLETAEQEYLKFREQAPLLGSLTESANVHRQRYEDLQAALEQAQVARITVQANFDAVEAAIKSHSSRSEVSDLERLAVIDKEHINQLQLLMDAGKGDPNTIEFQISQPQRLEAARVETESLLSLLGEEQSLLLALGPEHPRVQATRRKIDAAKDYLKTRAPAASADQGKKYSTELVIGAYRELLRQELETLQSRERQLEALVEKEQTAAKSLFVYELKAESLRKEVERKKELYDTLFDRLREINAIKEYDGFVQKLLGPIELGVRVSPKRSYSLAGGALFGLMIGGALALTAELRRGSFYSLNRLSATTNLPVLALTPRLTQGKVQRSSDQALDPSLCCFYGPNTRESEAFRGLRTALFRQLQQHQQKTISISSPLVGDGKSLITANLAISVARSDRRVLLIDADLRRPRQQELFGLSSGPGLAEVLRGEASLESCLQSTAVENLTVLASGQPTLESAELLSSPRLAELLSTVRQRFDLVLIDSVAILTVVDGCLVAAQSDGVLMVVRLPKDQRSHIVRAREMLHEVGAAPIGLVVNCPQRRRFAGAAKYFYGYGSKDTGGHLYYERN
jgi:capsular exopolysaccharide synthesis family protein